jgi:hypothetical protein
MTCSCQALLPAVALLSDISTAVEDNRSHKPPAVVAWKYLAGWGLILQAVLFAKKALSRMLRCKVVCGKLGQWWQDYGQALHGQNSAAVVQGDELSHAAQCRNADWIK